MDVKLCFSNLGFDVLNPKIRIEFVDGSFEDKLETIYPTVILSCNDIKKSSPQTVIQCSFEKPLLCDTVAMQIEVRGETATGQSVLFFNTTATYLPIKPAVPVQVLLEQIG